MKEDNEALVHSLKSQIAELNAEVLERDSKLDVNILLSLCIMTFDLHWPLSS